MDPVEHARWTDEMLGGAVMPEVEKRQWSLGDLYLGKELEMDDQLTWGWLICNGPTPIQPGTESCAAYWRLWRAGKVAIYLRDEEAYAEAK